MTILYVSPETVYANRSTWPTPAGLCTSIPDLLDLAAEVAPSTLVLERDPTGGGHAALVAALAPYGWTNASTTAGGWLTLIHPDHERLTLAVREWATNDPIIGDHLTWYQVCDALNRWFVRFVEPYRMTPGVAMLANMYPQVGSAQRKLQNRATAEWWTPPAQIQDLRWQALGTWALRNPLHRWDMRTAYLAAAAAVELPFRQLAHTGPHPETGSVGYYRIRITEGPTAGLGDPDKQGCHWVGHPVLSVLQRGPWTLEIIDSWTTTDYGRILRRWAERARDVLYDRGEPDYFRKAVKSGYAQAIGLLNVTRGYMYRPDWRHLIIDQTRASMIRRIGQVGQLTGANPVRIDVDSVWYDTADPTHIGMALGEGDMMGRMRYEGTGRFSRQPNHRLHWTPTEPAVAS